MVSKSMKYKTADTVLKIQVTDTGTNHKVNSLFVVVENIDLQYKLHLFCLLDTKCCFPCKDLQDV